MNYLVSANSKAKGLNATGIVRTVGSLIRILAAMSLLAAAAFGGLLYLNGTQATGGRPATLDGTWELQTLNGDAPNGPSTPGLIRQTLSLRAGKVRGETLLQPLTDQGVVKLPFPDESVDGVVPAAGESRIRVMWSGIYELDSDHQLTLHIGKAIYFLKTTWKPGDQNMELNQDIILTAPGAARYTRATAVDQASQHQ